MLERAGNDISESKRAKLTELSEGFWFLECPIGYLQEPYLPRLLREASQHGLRVKPDKVTYYTRRDIPSRVWGDHMVNWRKSLFFLMLRNARSATDQLSLPSDQVVEVGVRLNF